MSVSCSFRELPVRVLPARIFQQNHFLSKINFQLKYIFLLIITLLTIYLSIKLYIKLYLLYFPSYYNVIYLYIKNSQEFYLREEFCHDAENTGSL